ncbi:MAG: LacI family transcriptional regulator, partial [Bacteroidota bacterium]
KEHNYVPNNNAVSLRRKKTKTIGIILPQINLEPFSFFIYNFQLSAFQFGYRIVLFQTLNNKYQLIKYLNDINYGSVDGVIVLFNESKNSTSLGQINLCPIEYVEVTEYQSNELLITKSSNCLIELLNRLNKSFQ